MIDRVGDKPAPGRLRLVQAFLNTGNLKTGREDFASPAGLRDWLAENGLLSPKARVCDADVREAISVRNALFRLAQADRSGPADADAIGTLNRSIRSAQMSVSFGPEGRAHIEPLAPSVDGALGKLIAVVVDAMADGSWDRLKICKADTCSWAFFDRSKNHSGMWCDITDCGNIAKARTYRARHSHTHTSPAHP